MTVSANVGTLKRKRQIRDILDRQDADYQDDFVGATASRKRLTVSVLTGGGLGISCLSVVVCMQH